MIEVEARGKIEGNFDELVEKFRKIAKFKGEKERISFVYIRHNIKIDVREVLDDIVDLRLRVTNKQAEIIMKYGKWSGSDSREEYSVPINLQDIESAVSLLKCLDWDKGIIATTKTFVFDYKGIEFALVKYYGDEYYFEAEKMVENKKDIKKEKDFIKEECKKLGLNIFTGNEFMDYINYLNKNKNCKFDFKKQDFSYWKDKFKDYF
ncbi:MAG: hypothetical protein AABX35_01035 [Nanoarchaeota archaeon]